MDNISEVGKYIRETGRRADLALKRSFDPPTTVEKIRDIFDTVEPFEASIETPKNATRAILNLTFGRKLPAVGCCGDCYCGVTESYTSDSLIDDNIYLSTPYVPNSTVVYLDGVRVTNGVEYSESSPENKQLEIYIPFSTIVISYVYTVGNCSEDICIDTWPCPEYTILSGLATVFADRFDRGVIDENSYGGCGFWASGINGTPDTPNTGNFTGYSDNLYAHFGTRAIGRSIEIAAAVGPTTNISFTGQGFSYTVAWGVTFNSNGTYDYSMQANARYRYQPFPVESPFQHTTADVTFTKSGTGIAVPSTGFREEPKFVSAAQLPNGDLIIKVWVQGSPSDSGITQTLTVADYTTPAMSGDDVLIEEGNLIAPTFRAVRVFSNNLQAIKIGSGLDPGEVQVSGNNANSAHYGACYDVGTWMGWGYFGACSPTSISVTSGGSTFPSFAATVAFPVQVGNPPEALFGTGRIVDVNQHIGVVPARGGSAVIIRGVVRTFFALSDQPFSVVFQSFNEALPDAGNYHANGSQLASMTVPSNAAYLPFEIQVPVFDDFARWGVHIPNIEPYAESLAYIGGGFLSPPNHGLGIGLTDLEFEIVPEPNCVAREICGDCIDEVCPQINDSFNNESYTSPLTPSATDVERVTESGSPMILEMGDGTVLNSVGNGVGRVTWVGAAVDDYSALIFQYTTSVFDCRTSVDQDMFGSFEFKVNTLNPVSGYADIGFGGWFDGAIVEITIESGVVTGFLNFTNLPVSMSADVWMTAEYQTDGLDILARVYQSGTTPTAWTRLSNDVLVDGSNSPQTFYASLGYDQVASASNYEAEIKNVIIRRV